MIQQELSAQLSLTVLRCGSWHMPHGLALMGLSLGQVLPARQSQDCVQDSRCQTGADCDRSERLLKGKLPSRLHRSSHKSAPVALGFAGAHRVCRQVPSAQRTTELSAADLPACTQLTVML